MGKSKLDQWLALIAHRYAISGGQGRSGGAVLFSAILAAGGALIIVFICAIIIFGKTFGLL